MHTQTEAVNYTQRHPSMTVFLCSSPLHYSPLVYRLLSERERDGHGLQCILEGCFCTHDYQLPRVAASFSFSPHSQLSPDPYSTPSAIGIHYCLQWQMHSINGIMLILCHCQPDTSDASPTLASNGERLMVHVVTAVGMYQQELVDVLLLGVTCSLTSKALM